MNGKSRKENESQQKLRHIFTTNPLANGAAPKDEQALLWHSDAGTAMNIYAHSNRKTKRASARMLGQAVSCA